MVKKNRTEDLHDPTPATHGDLNIWGGRIQEILKDKADKADIARLEKRITKGFEDIKDHIDSKIDAAVENRAADLLGVKKDEIREIQRKVKSHEERITVLER